MQLKLRQKGPHLAQTVWAFHLLASSQNIVLGPFCTVHIYCYYEEYGFVMLLVYPKFDRLRTISRINYR